MLEPSFSPLSPRQTHAEEVAETLALHQAAHDFQREVDYREAFSAYCDWYAETARTHQAELAAMQQDIPFFSWFLGFKRKA